MHRRRFLALVGGAAAAGLGLSLRRGLRYPPLQLDPSALPASLRSPHGWRVHAHGAYRRETEPPVVLRAWSPEPSLLIEAEHDGVAELSIENLHPEATVSGDGVEELEREGLRRRLRFALQGGGHRELAFRFPDRARYRFVAIGDAGGRGELSWCLQRAVDLGADFVLHLGDIAYQEGDFEAAAVAFRACPVPIFAAIGNHDFHGGFRHRHRYFQEYFGPLDCAWELAGVRFLNLDTAADLVPADRGDRGALLREVRATPRSGPLVVYTHRPFADPRVLAGKRSDPHALNRTAEADWLRAVLLELGTVAMLCGHIHASYDFDDRGLATWISGDGLGVRGDKARILVGEFAAGGPLALRWEPLAMPSAAWSPEYAAERRDPAIHEAWH